MRVPVLWISRWDNILPRGYADQGLLESVLDRTLWTPQRALTFEHWEVGMGEDEIGSSSRGMPRSRDFPDVDGALVVLPARHHTHPSDVGWFLDQLDRLRWSVVILSGDEEWAFPWERVEESDRRRVWIMQPRPEHDHLRGIPGGWYPETRELIARGRPEAPHRPLSWFFAGQVTHARREACAAVLRALGGNGAILETPGYLQGMAKADYMDRLASAKVVPCPSGPMTVDTARPLEAMEAGCVPVVDVLTPRGEDYDYWALVFGGGCPLRRIRDWECFPAVLAEELAEWPRNANRVFAWWQQWKRSIAHALDDDLRTVAIGSGPAWDRPDADPMGDLKASIRAAELPPAGPDDMITVLVTTSPAPIHPSTDHIEQTIRSIREQLPLAEIVIACDGVREEDAALAADYHEYVRRLLWRCNHEWHNVVPVVLEEFGHQANATRAALELVRTPQVLFIEHDTPLCGDIPWADLSAMVATGGANAVQLHFNADLHPDHEPLLIGDRWLISPRGVRLRATTAWWQRPHLASTWFYRERIMPLVPPDSRTMIEDRVYGILESAVRDHGETAWDDWRVWMYWPDGSLQRSRHLDSRGDAPKHEMTW